MLIRLIALSWAIHLYRQVRDWRFGFLGAMIALMALRQGLTLSKKGFSWPFQIVNFDEIPGLIVSVLALLSVIFLGKMIQDERLKSKALLEANKDLENEAKQREKAEEQIRTLSQAVEQSPTSVIITDTEGRIEYVNKAFERITGYTLSEVMGQSPRILSAGEEKPGYFRKIWLKLTEGQSWRGEFRTRKKSGEMFWESAHIAPVFNDHGDVTHYLGVMQDISEQKQQKEQILRQALYDTLTNLPNRLLVMDRLGQMVKEAHRSRHKIALLFLDLDDFKKINDTLGHEAGDKVLVSAAERLAHSVREGDTVGRLGGDEFIVILGGLNDIADARAIAENLLEQFRSPFDLNNRELVLTLSIGIAIYPDDGVTPAQLLRNADTAMYHSKEQGRNTYHYYTESMNEDVSRRLELEEQLHGALSRQEFEIYYQPVVEISSRRIVGAEALLRWTNPALGMVSPDEFIPVAEQTGLIVSIGQFVMKESLQVLGRWRSEHPDFYMSINLSPRQLMDADFLQSVSTVLFDEKLQGDGIVMEITESVLMSGQKRVTDTLLRLANSEIGLAMDDFGTGYSSLSYLRRFPFDILKIDRCFIHDLIENAADRELISATIAMAKGLHLAVVAEGVETEAQLTYLSDNGCRYAQGYLFSRAVARSDFEQLLDRQTL